jgi:hypothetical protein
MNRIKLEKSLFEYLVDCLSNEKEEYINIIDDSLIDLNAIKESLLSSQAKEHDFLNFEIEDEDLIKLMQYVEDKQVKDGFINQDYLNEDGKKLQKIYDEIFHQDN